MGHKEEPDEEEYSKAVQEAYAAGKRLAIENPNLSQDEVELQAVSHKDFSDDFVDSYFIYLATKNNGH